jgi:type IV pilus assembly protein PilV
MKNHRHLNRQTGVMLLEGLFAILIFSVGILGIIGLQIASVKQSAQAKYRTDASLLANQLIGQMWVSDRTPATLQANFSSPAGAQFTAWRNGVISALPGVSASANSPTVAFNGNVATITVFWKAPNEPVADAAHKYVVLAQVR